MEQEKKKKKKNPPQFCVFVWFKATSFPVTPSKHWTYTGLIMNTEHILQSDIWDFPDFYSQSSFNYPDKSGNL